MAANAHLATRDFRVTLATNPYEMRKKIAAVVSCRKKYPPTGVFNEQLRYKHSYREVLDLC